MCFSDIFVVYGDEAVEFIKLYDNVATEALVKYRDEALEVLTDYGDEAAEGFKNGKTPDEIRADIESGNKSGLTQFQIDEILAIPKGSRPNPSTYLSKEYIEAHLAMFDDGASIIMTKEQYIQFVQGKSHIGIPDDGTQFVMPKNYCDEVAKQADGDVSIYEIRLGFDVGHFSDGGGLVRIDIDSLEGLNLRMPSGNEYGANNHWIPGGYTDGDVPEAVTDLIPNVSGNVTITELK